MTNEQKAIEILSRCGDWSRVGAASLIEKDLTKEEVEQLAAMHDDLAKADALKGATPSTAMQRNNARAAVGERYRQWVDAVADRRCPPSKEEPPPKEEPAAVSGETTTNQQ